MRPTRDDLYDLLDAIGFLASVIKSGEAYTSSVERVVSEALGTVGALLGVDQP